MTKHELLELYDQIKQLEAQLAKMSAPGSITARAHGALLAVTWLIDHRDTV